MRVSQAPHHASAKKLFIRSTNVLSQTTSQVRTVQVVNKVKRRRRKPVDEDFTSNMALDSSNRPVYPVDGIIGCMFTLHESDTALPSKDELQFHIKWTSG